MLLEIAQTTVSTLLAGGLVVLTARALGCGFLFPKDVRRLHAGLDSLERDLKSKDALIATLKEAALINERCIETLTELLENAESERVMNAYLSRDEVCQ